MRAMTRVRSVMAAAAAATAVAVVPAVPALAAPIPDPGTPSLPDYTGAAATAKPVKGVPKPPQNPFMAANPDSNIHNDAWQSDAYRRRGPLGRDPISDSFQYQSSLCGSLAFDSKGRILTVCPSIPFTPQARIIDPETLAPIDVLDLPNAPSPPGTREYQNFAGGGYLFVDQRDRIWVSTRTDHVLVIGTGKDGNTLTIERDYDLTDVLDEDTERINSALRDFQGRLWFVSKRSGKVGILDPKTRKRKVLVLDEQIQNSFAVAKEGVYIATSKRMYRMEAGKRGRPRVVWKHRYRNSGVSKPGQADAGTGTTPTIMPGGYVAITDNADPMDVVVYRRAKKLRGRKRVVCQQPVFGEGAGATENSLINMGRRSLIVENNYGYQDPFGPTAGAVTEAGFARVDVRKDGKGCRLRWTNREVRTPTAVSKGSLKTGLIYSYERPRDPNGNQGYYWVAIDYRTGRTVFRKYAGSSLVYNNNYAGLALGPNGDAYLGVVGGIIRLRDG